MGCVYKMLGPCAVLPSTESILGADVSQMSPQTFTLQVSGIRFAWYPNATAGARVVRSTIQVRTGMTG